MVISRDSEKPSSKYKFLLRLKTYNKFKEKRKKNKLKKNLQQIQYRRSIPQHNKGHI